MTDNKTIEYCLGALSNAGADKSQCVLTRSKKYEMNIEAGDITLLRTTLGVNLGLTAIKENKKGSIAINKVDEAAIDEAVKNVLELAESAEEDEDFDISPYQIPKEFKSGDSEPDLDKMYELMKGFIENAREAFPYVNIIESQLTFNYGIRYFANSNNVNFKESGGSYDFVVMFASKDKEKSSSFNYTGCSMKKLEEELLNIGTVRNLLRESVEQLDTKALDGKFVGDVIITPDCMGDMISSYLNSFLGDRALISGTSILKDKLEKVIASPKFTLHSNPLSKEICDGYFVTSDGFEAKDITLIDKGVLKSFLLSFYGANKTKLERAKSSGGAYIVEGGDRSLEEIISGIKKGIVVSRFSGGNPSSNGDFSGVAKNSYYIEDGKVQYPISETMISGNLLELFNNIQDMSLERVNFGAAIYPWMHSTGVTVSGK